MKKPARIKPAKRKCWETFSKFIRLRDCIETTGTKEYGLCCTCGKRYPIKLLHAGHFIPGRSNSVLWDERGVNAQCYACNVGLKGNWPAYYEFMLNKYGLDVINELLEAKHHSKEILRYELIEMTEKYKLKIEELESADIIF